MMKLVIIGVDEFHMMKKILFMFFFLILSKKHRLRSGTLLDSSWISAYLIN